MHSPKIVVCGATGNQGGAVAAALLKKGGWSVTTISAAAQDAGTRSLLASDIVMGNELAFLLSGSLGGRRFRYEAASNLYMRLTRPRYFDMRRFFRTVGKNAAY